jgi:hypothetical protein
MLIQQKIFAIFASMVIFIVIINLVKNGKLKEEYSWLWLLTGFVIIILALWYDLLLALTHLIGAVLPTTTLFIFAIIFLISIALHFAIKISMLTDQVKNLSQEIALINSDRLNK